MPPRRTPAAPEPQASSSTALALPADIRADLLRAQGEQITTDQQLTRAKVMAAGAGLFEFTDNNDTLREFEGVVLNSHPRNILWDKPYGDSPQDADGKQEGPACVANDGKYGIPREGFIHMGLPQNRDNPEPDYDATGNERIECATCPYNEWGSKHLIDPRGGKGKAVTNNKVIYVLVPGRETPVEVILPPTSIKNFDQYLSTLLNQGDPVQTVMTRFSQKVEQKGSLRWAVVEFEAVGPLNDTQFQQVMEKRSRYIRQITPQDNIPAEEIGDTAGDAGRAVNDDDFEPGF